MTEESTNPTKRRRIDLHSLNFFHMSAPETPNTNKIIGFENEYDKPMATDVNAFLADPYKFRIDEDFINQTAIEVSLL
jgi:hypothetical protein